MAISSAQNASKLQNAAKERQPMSKKKQKHLQYQWRSWQYKNTTLLLLSIGVVAYLASTPLIKQVITALGQTGYIGAFIVGIFFVSTFTVAPASVVLFNLADTLHPLEVAVFAGAGAMLGDYILLRYLKDKVFDEVRPLLKQVTTHKHFKMYYTPYFGWLTPLMGAIVIASPLPDEVGIGLMGLSRIKPWQFMLLAFLLNSIGIFLIVMLAGMA